MMHSTDYSYFRPTAWPGPVLTEPRVHSFVVSSTAPPWIHLNPWPDDQPGGQTPWIFDVPENAAEQEIARADVTNFDSMLNLATSLGGDLVPALRERWRDVISPHMGLGDTNYWELYTEVVGGWSDALGLDPPTLRQLFPTSNNEEYPVAIHVAEIAGRVWRLQTILRTLADQVDVSNSHSDGTPFPIPAVEASPVLVAGMFSQHLAVFSPHVSFDVSRLRGRETEVRQRRGWPPTALEVAALQLYNTLARGDGWKICQKCRQPFSTQVGRARHPAAESHRRSDSIYCSSRCSKAAAAKKRRDRDRELRETQKQAERQASTQEAGARRKRRSNT